jgi:hypothetical protein
MAKRVVVVAFVVTLVLAVFAIPGTAATKDPCKVLKKSEIAKAFGATTVGNPKKGLRSALSAQCAFSITGGTAGDGTLTVNVTTTGAAAAYKGLPKLGDYVPIAGYPKSLWSEKLSAVDALKGSALLGVQGGFPDNTTDIQSQLVGLSKMGVKRV